MRALALPYSDCLFAWWTGFWWAVRLLETDLSWWGSAHTLYQPRQCLCTSKSRVAVFTQLRPSNSLYTRLRLFMLNLLPFGPLQSILLLVCRDMYAQQKMQWHLYITVLITDLINRQCKYGVVASKLSSFKRFNTLHCITNDHKDNSHAGPILNPWQSGHMLSQRASGACEASQLPADMLV